MVVRWSLVVLPLPNTAPSLSHETRTLQACLMALHIQPGPLGVCLLLGAENCGIPFTRLLVACSDFRGFQDTAPGFQRPPHPLFRSYRSHQTHNFVPRKCAVQKSIAASEALGRVVPALLGPLPHPLQARLVILAVTCIAIHVQHRTESFELRN